MDELSRLALGCLLPGFEGTELPDWLRRRLTEGLGGVVLYARNVGSREQAAHLTAELHQAHQDSLVAIDEEGGDVTRVEAAAGSSYPGNLALGQVDDLVLTRAVAEAIGQDLGALGIDLDLAPVADVNSNPDNPVIGVRSFGDQPDRVAAHVAAFVDGLQTAGVAACAKHFPGHGDTSLDSHLELPTVSADAVALAAGPLVPFRAAIAAGVHAIMTAHVLVSAYDAVPATLSRRILTGLLRHELGFGGLIVTDALEMAAVRKTVGVEEAAVRALAAGADAICVGHDLAGDEVICLLQEAIVRAVGDGRLAEGQLEAAVARIRRVIVWTSARRRQTSDRRRGIGVEAARRAIRRDGNVQLAGGPMVVEFRQKPSPAVGHIPWGLGRLVADRDPQTTVLQVAGPPVDVDGILRVAAGRSLALVVRDLHRHAWASSAVEALLARRPDAITVEMGLPATRPAQAANYLATYGAARVNAFAALELLLGPPTEQVHSRSAGVRQLDTRRFLELMHAEDIRAVEEVGRSLNAVAQAVDAIADRLREGGRLHYFGAGTSGRLAALDAMECPATFGVSSDTVVAHVAGDDSAEDDERLGRAEAEASGMRPVDAVVGISAGGQTPYVRAAIGHARKQGALTVALTAVPGSALTREAQVTIVVATGPELIAGSTRLKAGTAQKIVLNMLSTGVFTRLGHVYRGRMVDVIPANDKLRRRAAQIVRDLTGAPRERVDQAIADAGGNAKLAVLMIQTGLPVDAARTRLAEVAGDLSLALGEHA